MKYKLIRITTVSQSLDLLLNGQLKYMSKEYEVIGIASPGPSLNKVKKREKIRVFPVSMTRKINPVRDFFSLLQLIRFFQLEKPHIVHTHTPKAGFLGIIAARIVGVPIRLHTVAGLPLQEAKGLKKAILILTEKITYRYCTMVYSNSFKMANVIIEKNYVSATKVRIIGNGSSNGINLDYFNPSILDQLTRDNLRKEKNINQLDFVFVFIGRIVKDKGIEELVTAFTKFHYYNANSKLILLGEYEMSLNPISNITFDTIMNHPGIKYSGYQEDIRPYLVISDVLVLPSYREGFPNVVMQACAFNVPCIVSNINGCNEIVANGFNGLIVEPKDINSLLESMIEVYKNKDLYLSLKMNCRKSILERFDQNMIWERLSKEYKDHLEKLKITDN